MIYYIVHSTSFDNEKGIVSGHFDSPLSAIGRSQAQNLQREIKHLDIDCVYASSLTRAVETAEILFPQHAVLKDNRLLEINFGECTHFPKSEIFLKNHIDEPFPRGESLEDVKERITLFLKEQSGHKNIAIVSHHAPQLSMQRSVQVLR